MHISPVPCLLVAFIQLLASYGCLCTRTYAYLFTAAEVGMALSSNGKYCVANYFPAVGNPLSYKYGKNLLPCRNIPPPWVSRGDQELPEVYKTVPCAEMNWKRHEEVSALLDEGAKYKPLNSLSVELPDLDPVNC
eukprot:Skav207524  [mRNA]  locus=scaffold907:320673:321724:+ [translate_table: standard]